MFNINHVSMYNVTVNINNYKLNMQKLTVIEIPKPSLGSLINLTILTFPIPFGFCVEDSEDNFENSGVGSADFCLFKRPLQALMTVLCRWR